MADQRWRGEKKQQMRKEPDPHQSLKWILKRTKVNRLFQLRRSDCFSVLEPSLISRASCCLKSQHCSRCLTWRVKNPASLYFFLPHRNAMNRFFFQLCSARCISRKQSENVRKTIGTPARCRLAAALKSTWNENDLVFFFCETIVDFWGDAWWRPRRNKGKVRSLSSRALRRLQTDGVPELFRFPNAETVVELDDVWKDGRRRR